MHPQLGHCKSLSNTMIEAFFSYTIGNLDTDTHTENCRGYIHPKEGWITF